GRLLLSIRYSLFAIRYSLFAIHCTSSPAETAADRDAAEDVALQEDGQRYAGEHRDGGAGHEKVPVGALLPLERGQAERNGGVIGVVDDDQRPQERVPLASEREEGEKAERRRSERDKDADEDA